MSLESAVETAVREGCARAKAASRRLALATTAQKNALLARISGAIRASKPALLAANAEDLAAADRKGVAPALRDRLRLDDGRLEALAKAVDEVAALPDPVGDTVTETVRPNGLRVTRVRAPLGLVAMVYEARPNVTVDASVLALKTGNAVVLRGGSEAIASNRALAALVRQALVDEGLPEDALVLLGTEREAIGALCVQSETVDLLIPRGGEALIRYVTEHARVPVVQHYKGVCHTYLDAGAPLEAAVRIVVDGKLARPSACNATECLLVDAADAARLLPPVVAALHAAGAALRGTDAVRAHVDGITPATDDDFGTEFLDNRLAIALVDGLDGALAHIARYGSGHTEAIVTPSAANAARFRSAVDAACVVVNASTRFHDGGELGLGAEIGIATSRLHWRGPMGLEALTTMKWLVDGDGQIRG